MTTMTMTAEVDQSKTIRNRGTISADPTPEKQAVTLDKYAEQYVVTTAATMTYRFASVLLYVGPFSVIGYVLAKYGPPSWLQAALTIPCALVLIGFPMSICLHRFFAHSAFKTSRPVQFILCVVACLAWQKGPLWWASKHRRHHKLCDKPGDPHSPTVSGFMYGWILWTMAYEEDKIDHDFVTKLMSFPELVLVNNFCLVPGVLLNLALLYLAGPMWMVCLYTFPMMLCAVITLLFNVEYHPAHKPGDTPCKSVDNARFFSELVGESYHDDHHSYPGKAHRPGLDLPYWLVLKPAEALGLIWKLKQR